MEQPCVYWVDDIVDTAGFEVGWEHSKDHLATESTGCYGDTWRPNNTVKLYNAPVLKDISELQEER